MSSVRNHHKLQSTIYLDRIARANKYLYYFLIIIIKISGTGLVSTLSINIQILLMFLVGFRVQEKM